MIAACSILALIAALAVLGLILWALHRGEYDNDPTEWHDVRYR